MNNENFRYYIEVRTALNISASVIYDELYSVHGDEAPCYRTVRRWAQWFGEGREEIKDGARRGRSITETTFENIEQVRLLINDDPHITKEEVQEQTGLSHGTVQRIITDHLNLKKVTARYTPKDLTDFERAERVRIYQQNSTKFQEGSWRLCDIITDDESWFNHTSIGRKSSSAAWVRRRDPPPTVVRCNRFALRTLFSIFFQSNDPVFIHCVGWGQAIDHHYYVNNCLRSLAGEIKLQRPSYGTSRIKIHHDNERPHIHKDVFSYLESEDHTVIPHLPNSPDLSPSDF